MVEGLTIYVDLLDTTTGHPQQTWRFTGQTRILVGRAPESDVVLGNPYVSRAHVYLEWENDGWKIVSISSQQIIVNDRRLPFSPVQNGAIFKLGSNGSSIRIRIDSTIEANQSDKTLSFNAESHPLLLLDKERLNRDVSEIADGDFFQNLRESLHRLRKPGS